MKRPRHPELIELEKRARINPLLERAGAQGQRCMGQRIDALDELLTLSTLMNDAQRYCYEGELRRAKDQIAAAGAIKSQGIVYRIGPRGQILRTLSLT